MSRTLLLSNQQVQQRISRLAWQLYEDNADEKEVVIVGILQSGNQVAVRLAEAIRSISPLQVISATLRINKHQQTAGDVELSLSADNMEGKVVIVVDDVLNSGKTLLYALRPFLSIDLRKIRTVVLVDRNHRRYPIAADYAGLSLATTLKEHVTVEEKDGQLQVFLD
jgi:pyrimidine operon attenuation protein/uracil phosphoribosyltransferase